MVPAPPIASQSAQCLSLDLGTRRKEPLHLGTPLLAAAGAAGVGALLHELCTSDQLGAIVLPPLSQGTSEEPGGATIHPITAGCLVTRPPTVGRRRLAWLVRRCRATREIPLIASIAPKDANGCERLCETILDLGLSSVELHVAAGTAPDGVVPMITLLASAPLQAVLVRLPLESVASLATAAAAAGADALVVAAPAMGRAQTTNGTIQEGEVHAPSLQPLYAQAVQAAASAGIPVIGRGGIASWEDVRTMLASGAMAVQLDSILWAEPAALEGIYQNLQAAVTETRVSRWEEYLQGLRA